VTRKNLERRDYTAGDERTSRKHVGQRESAASKGATLGAEVGYSAAGRIILVVNAIHVLQNLKLDQSADGR
jgi:hypothetical protein